MITRKLGLVIALIAWTAAAFATSTNPSFTAFKSVQIAAGDTKYSAPIQWGKTTFQAMDWQIATASGNPDIKVTVLQSNNSGGPFTQWSDPLDGNGTITNSVTITTTNGGTPWRCTPSDWVKYAMTNQAVVTATVTVRDYSY